MIEKIVVPLDGSARSEEILPQLRRLLCRSDSEVLLVRAVVPPPLERGPVDLGSELAAARSYLEGVARQLIDQGARATVHAREGPAAGAILDLAAANGATLIALATHGQTGLKRVLLGSVAEQVIRKSSVPVLVARPFWSYDLLPRRTEKPSDQPFRTLLVPFDGSEASKDILPAASEMAELFGSRVVFLAVTPTGKKGASRDVPRLAAALREASLRFEAKGLETLSLVRRGDPAGVILETAQAERADLMAMATHGRSGLSRLIGGSVTEEVLRRATCPLLVVRATKAARHPKTPVPGHCVGR